MNKQFVIVGMLVFAMLSLQSCSGNRTKKRVEPPKSPPAAEEQVPVGKETANPEHPEVRTGAVAIPVKKRPPAQLVAALPCKLEGKEGVFAAFPDNPVAGQVCFGLNPAQGNEAVIPKFDIQGGGVQIIFHFSGGNEPGGIRLMRWEKRDGKPCLEAACGKEIPVKSENYSAPGESGWAYKIITPEKPLDFASAMGGYVGLVIGANKYIPLFW